MLQGCLRTEQSQCEDERIKTEGLREACRQQRDVFQEEFRQQREVFQEEYMRSQDQHAAQQARHSSLEQLLTATENKAKEAGQQLNHHEVFQQEYMQVADLLRSEQTQYSSLEQLVMVTKRDAEQAAEMIEFESSRAAECDALYKRLAVVERQRSAIDADACSLRQRLAASEVLVEALSEEPLPEVVCEVDSFKKECFQLTEKLQATEARVEEVIQKTVQQYSAEGDHHRRVAASTVEALQEQVEQAVAAASEARHEVFTEMQRCQDLQQESSAASGAGISPLQRLRAPDVNAVERRAALDIELQKQVILGALQRRGGPSR